ncbi:HpcH/HpaI aldolase/citrate lyase family protein [Parachitinimonas caeni]|uniref:HpcH/HpaI aldolase/citrate lyase family protein n=1 Tax=Parachitinimonas caeni TaxID=3031301 RepID=A0ABT7E3P4_9NEIS|nr:HpcH/HpaI aldolase/citrate lyase family protein [Parachitinimonas caeni]MDK2126931.1 HpcH/HpaI aldolase/citrate lyase family protein [Parachitinimonas caeni]
MRNELLADNRYESDSDIAVVEPPGVTLPLAPRPLPTLSPHALGATLYMPATRPDLTEIIRGHKHPGLRSLVICLEDAIGEAEIGVALRNLEHCLQAIDQAGGRPDGSPLIFVRPRSCGMAALLAQWPLFQHVDGLVAPKLTLASLGHWQRAVEGTRLLLMPTLETREVFDPGAMVALRDAMLATLRERILALRIGGNDLMACLGLRRMPGLTAYQSPMGYVIAMLCGVMGSSGFALTAPVFEQLHAPGLLQQELELDIAHGLVGKTAIHPAQVPVIHAALQVSSADYDSAQAILCQSAPAVFQFNGAMCEPATHAQWARQIVQRAHWYGIRQPEPALALARTA